MHCPEHALLSVLDEHGPTRVTRLATELERHPLTVTTHCQQLHADGHVQRLAADVYGITATGRERLSADTE
ncbi:MarR family transcriptional regulator [Natronolimnobius sp. AArcel1]|uniref:MarR family transcriptional regulator n=1 Tax=Natronolimnobius sp. AArcel1 TaxID=1679093 RepID=UPI0013EA8133|nr:MarR family transcriptional regulator [Natronolimnobius sp. AArcel1]NGM68817.1 MarR family transcriptional regulator [Natronolimnobius sp. AArcel1]